MRAVEGEEDDGLEEELHRDFSCDGDAKVTVVTSQRRRGRTRCVLDALYICEPFRERSKIGGSLLSSEGPAFEVYIDAAPCPRACFYAFSLSAQPKLRRADSHN